MCWQWFPCRGSRRCSTGGRAVQRAKIVPTVAAPGCVYPCVCACVHACIARPVVVGVRMHVLPRAYYLLARRRACASRRSCFARARFNPRQSRARICHTTCASYGARYAAREPPRCSVDGGIDTRSPRFQRGSRAAHLRYFGSARRGMFTTRRAMFTVARLCWKMQPFGVHALLTRVPRVRR